MEEKTIIDGPTEKLVHTCDADVHLDTTLNSLTRRFLKHALVDAITERSLRMLKEIPRSNKFNFLG